MSEERRQGITDLQAETRRQNGKQSRGPRTEEGKRRSSQNATTHGHWARKLYPLLRGPLREDPEELSAFLNGYIRELNPGSHVILQQMALDAADKAWRVTRAQLSTPGEY
jgi:hypothetical protein